MLLMRCSATRNHRPHPVAKSRQPDHPYVDQQKAEQNDGQKEMNRARGLLSAEHA